MSFSDLVHKVEADVSHVLLPSDNPSDTREVEALAKKAEGIAVAVDPELAPIFDRVGVLGDYIEQALTELGSVVGQAKTIIATRAQQVPPPATPEPVASEPSAPPASDPGSTEPSTGATSSEPAPTSPTPPASAPGASMSDAIPPVESSPPPVSTPLPAPATSDTPASIPPATSDVPQSASIPEGVDPSLLSTEDAFAALSPEDRAAFETAEGLEPLPVPLAEPVEIDPLGTAAAAEANSDAGTDAGIAAAQAPSTATPVEETTPPPPA